MKRKQLPVDLIIFDLDMTLVDSQASIYACFADAFKANGLPPPDKREVAKLVGIPLERMAELLLLKAGVNATAELNAAIVKAYRERYARTAGKESALFPGVIEMLEYFKEKRIALLTTKESNLTRQLLGELDILKYFNLVLGYGDYRSPKPDPEAVFKALNETKVPAGKAVIVGDTIYDIEAGKSAGIHTVAVSYGVDPVEELKLAKPEFIVDDIRELMKLLV